MIPKEILRKVRQIEIRTNRLVDKDTLGAALAQTLDSDAGESSVPPCWDGKTAERAVEALRRRLT